MSITYPTQAFEHKVDKLKGWPIAEPLDHTAKLSPNVSATALPILGGRVVHVNAQNDYELGATGFMVAIHLQQDSNAYDVRVDGNAQVNAYGYQGVSPVGTMSGLVSLGAFELESTEIGEAVNVAFSPNDPLHAPTEAQITGADKSAAGKLFKTHSWPGGDGAAIARTENICGMVSLASTTNHYRQRVVRFWPCFFPGVTGT